MQHYQFFSINITMAEFAKNVIISEILLILVPQFQK